MVEFDPFELFPKLKELNSCNKCTGLPYGAAFNVPSWAGRFLKS